MQKYNKPIYTILFCLIASINCAKAQFSTTKRSMFINVNEIISLNLDIYNTKDNTNSLQMPKEQDIDFLKELGGLTIAHQYANTSAWVLSLYENPNSSMAKSQSENYTKFEKIKSLNPQYEFIVPYSKWEYSLDNDSLGHLTYETHSVFLEEPMYAPFAFTGKKMEGFWKRAESKYSTSILSRLSVEFCQSFWVELFSEQKSKNEEINRIRERTLMSDGSFNVTILYHELFTNVMENESLKPGIVWTNQDSDYYSFANNERKKTLNVKLAIPVLKDALEDDYFLSTYSEDRIIKGQQFYLNKLERKDWLAEQAVINFVKKQPTDTLFFIKKISFYDDSQPVAIIKYQLLGKYETVTVEMINGVPVVTNNPKYDNYNLVVKSIKQKYWSDFINGFTFGRSNDIITKYQKDYCSINIGANWDNLAEVLKRKPKDLEPYCDFD